MNELVVNDPTGYWAKDGYITRGNERRLWNAQEQAMFAWAINFLVDDQMIHPTLVRGRALEVGCGPGQNLWMLQKVLDMDVTGLDVSPRAAKEWATHDWDMERTDFRSEDVFASDWFWNLPEPAFDLVITRWFLTHVQRGPEKTKLIEKLKAVGRSLVCIEGWYQDPRKPDQYFADDHWVCLDDWEDYGLTEYELFRPHFSKIFYHNRP